MPFLAGRCCPLGESCGEAPRREGTREQVGQTVEGSELRDVHKLL